MIVFETEFIEYFNKKIHIFLEAEIFYDDSGSSLDFLLPSFFPRHLVREQEKKCKAVMEDLFDWTGDRYLHTMTAFHETALYSFLDFMRDIRHDMQDFDSIFYGKDDRAEINALWRKLDINAMFEGTMKGVDDLVSFLHDIDTMQELCFEDVDFLMLPDLSNYHGIGDYMFEDLMGIDFDYYKEILPKDIRARHEKQMPAPTLYSDIEKMLDFIADRITFRGLHKPFWNKNKPLRESEAQVLLDSLFATYFKDSGYVDISREADIGTGKIDFKFYKDSMEMVLIEVKLGSRPNLEKGIKNQLVHYMKASKCNEAFYLVICHYKTDITRAERLHKVHEPGRRITPYIFDVSSKTVASRL